jgi:hypothetical protein
MPVNGIGLGWTFTLMSGICVVFSPIMFIVMHHGPNWRKAKHLKLEEAQKQKAAKLAATTNEKTV